MDKDASKEDKEFTEFVSKAIRARRKGIYEYVVGQHLQVAVASKAIDKIRFILEAIFSLPKEELEKLDIDIEEVEKLYSVTMMFINSYVVEESVRVGMPWDLFEEAYEYLAPLGPVEIRFAGVSPYDKGEYMKIINELLGKVVSKGYDPDISRVVIRFMILGKNGCLFYGSFEAYKTRFLMYAMPKVQSLLRKISRVVEPDVYRELLEASKGVRK